MRQFMLSIPDDEIWSARVDGASEWRIYRSVVLPQLKPALATLGMLTFMFHWNAYLWPLIVLTEQDKRTLPIILTWYSTQHTAAAEPRDGGLGADGDPGVDHLRAVAALDRARSDLDGHEMTTVTLIGAGSAEFAAELVTDLLSVDALPKESSGWSTSIRCGSTSPAGSPST